MRTTVTLDPDTDAAVRKLMRERGLSFKEAVNAAIRAGAAPRAKRPHFDTPTFAMGAPSVSIDKALRLAADLEDEEIIRKLGLRK
jgi:hypothetical protein